MIPNKKTLLAILAIVACYTNSSAFDSGLYTCELSMYKMEINLKDNGRFNYNLYSSGYKTEFRGKWEDDDDAAIFVVENQENILKKQNGQYFLNGQIACQKNGEKSANIKTNKEYLIAPSKEEIVKQLQGFAEKPSLEEYYVAVTNYTLLEKNFFIYLQMIADASKSEEMPTKEKFLEVFNQLKSNVKIHDLSTMCQQKAAELQLLAGKKNISIPGSYLINAQEKCAVRMEKSLKNALNINNYPMYK